MTIEFTVLGKPQGKARPRFDGRNGRTYTPKETREYEELVRLSFLRSGGKMLTGEITAHITAYFLIPESTPKSKKRAMLADEIRPAVKPDLDNIIKAILDALNGYAYKDDAAVVKVTAAKEYAEYPYVAVRLEGDGESP